MKPTLPYMHVVERHELPLRDSPPSPAVLAWGAVVWILSITAVLCVLAGMYVGMR